MNAMQRTSSLSMFTGAAGMLAASVLCASSALAAPPRPGTTPPDRPQPMPADAPTRQQPVRGDAGSVDTLRAAEIMRSHGITLEKVIAAAESHAGGQAIEARVRTAPGTSMSGTPTPGTTTPPGSTPRTTTPGNATPGSATLLFDVTVLDKSGQLVTVNVDGTNGNVTGTRPYSGERLGSAYPGTTGAIVKASDVVGRDIVDVNNREIGEIDEIAIDVGRSRIAYAIIELTDGPNQLLAVPWTSLRHHDKNCVLDLAGDRRLSDAPRFERTRWPDMSSGEFSRRIAEFWGDRSADREPLGQGGQALRVVKSGDIIGGDVRSSSDENLGSIDDLALDMHSNRVAYAVVSFGGFLGFGDKLFAIPVDAFTRDSEGRWVLAVSKERLKEAPGFDKKNWPNMADPAFDTRMRDFYRVDGTERVPAGADRPR